MSTIDQFESVFRSALRPSYQQSYLPLVNLLLISDLGDEEASQYLIEVEKFFTDASVPPKITHLAKEKSVDLDNLLSEIDRLSPDLIITHRHLHSSQANNIYTLGDHIEVLTQITSVPILLFPHHQSWRKDQFSPPDRIMVLSDQLSDNPTLVDAAVSVLSTPGHLLLAHVEDEATFEYYLKIIAKLPELDTELAREQIKEQLLKEAELFTEAITKSFQDGKTEIITSSYVSMGHPLKKYVSLVKENQIDLVVIQGKDEEQVAILGMSYALAVELNELPLLIL